MRARVVEHSREADGRAARDRPDRLGQVDDALRRARRHESPGDQHHHRRGSGRVPARRDQAGADQPPRRAHLRHRAAVDPPLRPRRRHGRRDPRRRDREDLDRGGAHRAHGALDAAHERRALGAHPAERDGRRAVHHRGRGLGRARAATGPQALRPLRDCRTSRPSTSSARCTSRTSSSLRSRARPSAARPAARAAATPAIAAGSASSSSSR